MKIFLVLVALFFLSANSIAQTLQEVSRLESGLIFPSDFHVVGEDRAIVIEPLSDRDVVTLVNLETGNVIASLRAGRGPGEVHPTGKKVLSRFTNDHLWLWDSVLRRGMLLDNELLYIEDVDTGEGNFLFALPISENNVVTWSFLSRSELFTIRNLDGLTIGETTHSYLYDEFGEFNPIPKNPLSRQGPTVSDGSAIYQGYFFSSNLLKVDHNGEIQYVTGHEMSIPFPDYDSEPGVIEAPDHGEFPEATMSLAVNNQYLFVLHSGRIFEEGLVRSMYLQLTGRWEELNAQYDHSDRLLVYDKQNGKFIREIALPEKAHKISATDDHLYIYSYLKNPVIITYKMDF